MGIMKAWIADMKQNNPSGYEKLMLNYESEKELLHELLGINDRIIDAYRREMKVNGSVSSKGK